MKYVIEYTDDTEDVVGQEDRSPLWQAWGSCADSSSLEHAKTLLQRLRDDSTNEGTRYRLLQTTVIG